MRKILLTAVGLAMSGAAFAQFVPPPPPPLASTDIKMPAKRMAPRFPRPRHLSGHGRLHNAVRAARGYRRHAEGRLLPGLDARQFRAH